MSETRAPFPDKPSLTVVILTRDEARHIERCITRIAPIARRILVVDSFSRDETAEIARALGAEVHQRQWVNYADQFQWALDHAGIDTQWVMRLDADEYCEPALLEEIADRLPRLDAAVTGVLLRRRVIFRGRWIRWGGYYPTILLRLWRSGAGRIEQRWMDEHCVLTHGEAVAFKHDFVDENLNDITWWTAKHNAYATRQMIDFINEEHDLFPADRALRSTRGQAGAKRFLKERVFGAMPLYLRGTSFFFLRYVLLLGFLDGRQGFLFHFLQGWWNWMLVDAKIDEARSFIRAHGVAAFRAHLAAEHGLDLDAVPTTKEKS